MNEPHPIQSGGRPFGRLLLFVLPSFGYMGLYFLLNPLRMRLLTQYLPKDLYGRLTLATTTLTFIAILSSLGGLKFLLRRLPGMMPGRQHGLLRMILVRLALGLTSWLSYRIYYSLGRAKLMLVRTIQLQQNDLWFVGIVAAGAWAAASLTYVLWNWTGWLFLVAGIVRMLQKPFALEAGGICMPF
ncbi:MAG: hypothetical protein GX803_02785 [Lentisphaerae bacterium]|jgi:hypothetical protein|nr:hypothetical protein [Lentisphaerota bacterium]